MLIEEVELGLAAVGLGQLREGSLLSLFATAQAHRLTQGCGHTLHGVTDAAGSTLYPSYFWLHLRVPATHRLDRYRLWDRVAIGVDVKRFGKALLDSTYLLGAPGEVPSDPACWDLDAGPSLRSSSLWTIDRSGDAPAVSVPRAGAIADLPMLTAAPEAMQRLRDARIAGTFPRDPHARASHAPLPYALHPGRDAAVGRNVMFATYVEIMDVAERALLSRGLWPALPGALVDARSPLEREVFFLANTMAGQRVLADVRASIQRCESDLHGSATEVVSAGTVDITGELYEESSGALLTIWRARQVFVVPRAHATLLGDLARFFRPA